MEAGWVRRQSQPHAGHVLAHTNARRQVFSSPAEAPRGLGRPPPGRPGQQSFVTNRGLVSF